MGTEVPFPKLIAVPLKSPEEVVIVALNPFGLVILLSAPSVKLLVKLWRGFPSCRTDTPPDGRFSSGAPFVKE